MGAVRAGFKGNAEKAWPRTGTSILGHVLCDVLVVSRKGDGRRFADALAWPCMGPSNAEQEGKHCGFACMRSPKSVARLSAQDRGKLLALHRDGSTRHCFWETLIEYDLTKRSD